MESGIKTQKARNSAFELLRFTAILLVLISHSKVHSGFPDRDSLVVFNNYLLDWMKVGNIATDIFVLISGYFLCLKENPRSSLPRLWAQVWFYSAAGLLIFLLMGGRPSLKETIGLLLPTVFEHYWFFSCYIVLILFAPVINYLIKSLTKKQFLSFLGLMYLLWCIVPTLTLQTMFGEELAEFLLLYCTGAWFRLYPDNIFSRKALRRGTAVLSFFLLFLSSALLRLMGKYTTIFYLRSSLLVVGCALGMFTAAVYAKPFESKIINKLGSCCFGVYLFHEHSLFIDLIWLNWLPNLKLYDSGLLIFGLLGSCLLLLAAGLLFELLRQKIFDKPMTALAESLLSFIKKLFSKLRASILPRLSQ